MSYSDMRASLPPMAMWRPEGERERQRVDEVCACRVWRGVRTGGGGGVVVDEVVEGVGMGCVVGGDGGKGEWKSAILTVPSPWVRRRV